MERYTRDPFRLPEGVPVCEAIERNITCVYHPASASWTLWLTQAVGAEEHEILGYCGERDAAIVKLWDELSSLLMRRGL